MLSRNRLSVSIDTVLFETDTPELLLARDPFDSAYLCSLAAEEPGNHLFLAIQISSDRLASLRSGEVDLLTVLLEPEILPYFTGRFILDAGSPTLNLEAVDTVQPDWLPNAGFFMSSAGVASTEKVVTEAMRRNTAIVSCTLHPPEAQGTTAKINAERLSEWLHSVQSLVRYATRLALKGTSRTRLAQFGSDPFVLQVYGFSPGSFTVHFSSQEGADLVGLTPVGAGMKKIDELMSLLDTSPDKTFEALAGNSGHVVAAFESLLKFVAEQESPMEYRWAEPSMGLGRGHSVTPVAAKAMVAVLETTKSLKTETVEFEGQFTSVNTDNAPLSWRAIDLETGRKRHGRVHEDFPEALNGVTIRDTRYKLICEERLERYATGRTRPTLYLKHPSTP